MSETLKFRILIYLHLNVEKSVLDSSFLLRILVYYSTRLRVSLEDFASPVSLVAYGGESKGNSMCLEPDVNFLFGIRVISKRLVLSVTRLIPMDLRYSNVLSVSSSSVMGSPSSIIGHTDHVSPSVSHFHTTFSFSPSLKLIYNPFAFLYIISLVCDGFRPKSK